MFCSDIIPTTLLFFSTETPPLLYYSHIPTALIALFLGFFVYISNKQGLLNRIFLILNISYAILIILNLFIWTNSNIPIITVVWLLAQIIGVVMPILAVYFFYVFINKRRLPLPYGVAWGVLILALIILVGSKLNLTSFDATSCELVTTNVIFIYQSFIFLLVFLSLFISFFKSISKKSVSLVEKRESIILFTSIFIFLVSYIVVWQLAELHGSFNLEQYGLFGMTLLLSVVSFIIVRFKAFDIKLIGSQALVWALVILIGSEFFFVTSTINQILVAITLVLSAVVGLIIVRSVKKEIAQREELAVANENQQLLIRFITHQVKGFFTKSKMVFASILEGDVGDASEPLKNLVKEGLESDNKAVEMVQEVLKASSLRSGTMTYDLKEEDISPFVNEIAEGYREMAVQKGLTYEVKVPTENMKVKMDKLQMTQVFKNLIDNSVKYTPTGYVKVDLKAKTDTVLFSIHDSGVGLSDSDKAKLFKEGGRGEESLKVNVNSTGYGLFIVKKIVEGHGGKIWAASAGRGHGSQFYVELPLLK